MLAVLDWLTWRVRIGASYSFLAYAASLFAPVQALTGMYQTLRRGKVALETLETILDAPDALSDAHDAVSTTLMILLQRLYDVREGQILIDGIDVRRLKQRALRENIGVVLQEGILFSGSIRENIAFGRREATMDEIVAAAKAANAHDFIMALPDGYDTRVGWRGVSLCGGERQRIAVARAVLKDPAILILDEATSALDAESEALVQEALERLCHGRTTFVIAHRLSTVTGADRIAVVKDGRIFETGTHDELLARDSHYAGLVSSSSRASSATPSPPRVERERDSQGSGEAGNSRGLPMFASTLVCCVHRLRRLQVESCDGDGVCRGRL